ncbi:hypothetical protein HOY82DRAFT_593587 [Tuber indicum]|nr:hypothetical protein HOY82DRAFT_593587 [Tuber indicum]
MSVMNPRRIIYARWLSVAIPLLYFLLWTTTSSTAYPYPHSRNYLHLIEPSPTHELEDSAELSRPHKLKGPLWCNGTITAEAAGEETHLWGLLLSAGLLITVGEVLPQIIFPRYPVAILGNMMWFIYIILALYAIPAGILVLILHYTVGRGPRERRIIHNTKQLSALVDLHPRRKGKAGKLSVDSVRVMLGALDLENRVAGDIMKPISDVKMLDVKDRMNIHRWKEVINWGHLLIAIQDMMSPDPGEVTTLRSVPIHALPIVPEDYPLWDLLHLFQEGLSHIAVVEKVTRVEPKQLDDIPVNNPASNWGWIGVWEAIRKNLKFIRKEGDHQQPVTHAPKYWTDSSIYRVPREQPLGIVTMEDVLKPLLRSSIFDEKDISHCRRRRGNGNDSPRRVFESELQSPFSGGSLDSEELEIESELPGGLAIRVATRNGNKGSDSTVRRKQNSGNNDLSFSKPLAPLSGRDRRRKALSDPLGGAPIYNSPNRLPSKANGKRKGFEARKAMSENNYSTNASDDFELESFTETSVPSSIFSHSTGNTSYLMDLLVLTGEHTNSSDFSLSTLDEERSVPVHNT